MRKINVMLLFLLILASLPAIGQDAKPQLTPIPPKPTCTPFFQTGACHDLWTTYNQALAQRNQEELQIYVNRQKELASAAATAPLQQQLASLTSLTADLQARINRLHEQAQSDTAAALVAQSAAHQQGLWEGLEIGVGGIVLLVLVFFGIKRLTRTFTITKKAAA